MITTSITRKNTCQKALSTQLQRNAFIQTVTQHAHVHPIAKARVDLVLPQRPAHEYRAAHNGHDECVREVAVPACSLHPSPLTGTTPTSLRYAADAGRA
jgi:hypothetical protein